MSDRVLLLGTPAGVLRVEMNGKASEPRNLGLGDRGGIRYPVVIDLRDPKRLYVGTNRGGMFRSEDAGHSWREINEGIVYKEIWSVVQHPSTGDLYAGTGPAAVFKSTDGGDSWQECEQLRTLGTLKAWTFPGPPFMSHVKGMGLYAGDPGQVWGSVEEGWVIRSKDGGKTWENIKDGVEFDNHSITVMPDNPQIVVSTAGTGVYRSTNGGDSFEASQTGLICRYMSSVVVHPDKPNVLFAAAAEVPPPFWRRPEGANAMFYRSDDQGASWRRLEGGLPAHIAAGVRAVAGDPQDANAFYVGLADGVIWLTEDGGDSFRQIAVGLPQVTSICVSHP